jgi:hypothetical protein
MHRPLNDHSCNCGASFKSKYRLAVHVQKWNSKFNLRDQPLTRRGNGTQ